MIPFALGDTLITKKPHACGCDRWQVVRVGADVKFRCTGCDRVVLLPLEKAVKAVKKILTEDGE